MDAAEKIGKGGWNMGPYEYVVESIYDNGEPMMIAMALLPDGVDVGTRLRWENLVYSVLE